MAIFKLSYSNDDIRLACQNGFGFSFGHSSCVGHL